MKALLILAGIPRSTYYYWVKQLNKPDKDAMFKTLIKGIYDETKDGMGIVVLRMS